MEDFTKVNKQMSDEPWKFFAYTRDVMTVYNMVGVAVAMVISTMHEKSCIDLHNARKFEKSSKIQSFKHLAITMMKLRKYHSHELLKLLQLYDAIIQKVIFLQNWARILIWIIIDLIKNYRHIT